MTRLRRAPFRYVAQPKLELATVPVLRQGELRPGHVTVRMHATHSPTGTWVMPGGTGRVVDPGVPIARQASRASKDVWVMSADAVDRPIRVEVAPAAAIDLRSSLPSRAAEALYWLGRRAERAGTLVHTVRATQASIDQDPGLRDLVGGAWERRITAILDAAVISMGGQPGEPTLPVSSDGAMAAALRTAADEIDGLVEGASTVREFLSTTTWQVTQMLAEQTPMLRAGRPARATIDNVVMALAALAGLTAESVVRGPSWRFLDVGRRTERALQVATMIDHAFGGDFDPELTGPVGEVVLAANECLVAYRRRYRTDVDGASLADLLLLDPSNPRSLGFQLARLADDLAELPPRAGVERCQSIVADAIGRLDSVAVATEAAHASWAAHAAGGALAELGRAVTATWFAASTPETARYGWTQ